MYSTTAYMASEITELSNALQSRIDSEKASLTIYFGKVERYLKINVLQNKTEWIQAFRQIKTSFNTSITNMRSKLNQTKQEHRMDKYIGYKPDFLMVEKQIEMKLKNTLLNR